HVNIADIFTGRLLTEIPPALSHLLEALVTLPELHTIDLSDNAFGLNTQAPLVAFLSAHTPLRKLILNNNGLGPRAGKLIADALTELAAKKEASRAAGRPVPDLETVVCGRNRLENGSMAAWARAFAAHRAGIKEVRMTQNGIRPEGVETLLRNGLKHATGLRVLDLQDNTFTLQGATALADVVPGWSSLTDLGVGDCLLKKRGAILLFRALHNQPNTNLRALRLAFNDIDIAGLADLKRAVTASLPALRRVELNGNRFSDAEPDIDAIRDLLLDRLGGEQQQQHTEPVMDELEDMDDEEESESEEEEEEEEEEAGRRAEDVEKKAEKLVRDDEEAEEEEVAQEKDESVDALTKKLEQAAVV
ncbi:hypothetical protein GP486_008561, partial [Trichoglossum hirsutum]